MTELSKFESVKQRNRFMRQILRMHTEGPPDDGLTYYMECRWHWPCPPVVLLVLSLAGSRKYLPKDYHTLRVSATLSL